MKRRLNIACAIAHNSELIIMDEPTVGIDPQSRTHILESIKQLRDAGATVIYTTHYMGEVEAISTRIVIMDHGLIIASGTKEDLKQSLADGRLYTIDVAEANGVPEDALYGVEGVKRVESSEGRIQIATVQGIEYLDKIIAALIGPGFRIRNLTSSVASLEMVFLNLTGRSLRN